MSTTLMTCGHTAQGITTDGKPACAICGTLDVAAERD